jgi:hypothetical protein
MKMICHPCCGTSAAATKPGIAPPIGTQPTTDAKACKQAQPEHLIEVCRIGRRQGENAEEQVRPDQRRLAAVAVADPTKQCRPKQNANEACAEHRAERTGFQPPFPDQTGGCKRDRGDVVAIDKNNKKRPDNQLDLK